MPYRPVFILAGALALAACQNDGFQGLTAKIAAKTGTPTDSAMHYVVDFGPVLIGTTAVQSLTITNLGRAELTVPPPIVTAPFGTGQTVSLNVAQNDLSPIPFSFTPSALGPATETVTIKSNGGSLTVDLEGSGTNTPPVCTFAVSPMTISFGTVAVGATQTSGVRITNTGSSNCSISGVEIDPASDSAFTLSPGQTTSDALSSGAGSFPIGVVFAPATAGSFTGTLTLQIGSPATTVNVPLNGVTPAVSNPDAGMPVDAGPGVCAFTISPTSLSFGNVLLGHSGTEGFVVKNTGSVECDVSGIALDPATDPGFAFAAGQATSGMLARGATLPVEVVFTPSALGLTFTGKVDLTVGPPGSAESVPMTARSTQLCADPNPNGTCPVAMAPIYLNDDVALYSYTPSTNVATLIGAFSAPGVSFQMYDIGINQQGVMYGVSENTLYIVNPTNAACLKIGTLTDSPNGMTVLANGDIVVAGDDVEIIDGTTYTLKQTLVPAFTYSTSGDIVYLPDGNLYWTVTTGTGNDKLVRVNPATGATTVVGTMSDAGIWGLAYYDSVLYGFTKNGKYVIIDPSTGGGTGGSVPGAWYGATTNPAAR